MFGEKMRTVILLVLVVFCSVAASQELGASCSQTQTSNGEDGVEPCVEELTNGGGVSQLSLSENDDAPSGT